MKKSKLYIINRKKIKMFAAVMVFAMLGQLCFATSVQASSTDTKKVRVGYFAFEGYQDQDEEGNRSGYGYEYLQQMARYAGWTYDYVGYDKSWSEAQDMLENGEIDLLTSAQKTEEREKIFDFSDNPIGYSSTIFTIKAGNEKYTIDDFSTFNGMHVGMIEGNSRNEQFDEFAEENHFTYQPVMFESTDEMVQFLQDGKIDAIVTSSLRATKGEWIVAQFHFSPYYVCVKKGNKELLDQVNTSIDKINNNYPGLQNELNDKYYGADSGSKIAFTEQERKYIDHRNSQNDKLKVMINPDRIPMSFYENGDFEGILGSITKKVFELSGLPYEIIVPENRQEYDHLRDTHQVDVCVDMRFDYNMAERLGYRITDQYYTASVSRITGVENADDIRTVAVIENSDVADKVNQQFGDTVRVMKYPSSDDCVKAVMTGEADAVYLYTYSAENFIAKDYTNKIASTLVPDFSTSFCMGIGDMSDADLFEILNKSVQGLDSKWVDEITLSYTDHDEMKQSLLAFAYAHPVFFTVIVMILVSLIFFVIMMIIKNKNQKEQIRSSKEMERFIEYMCKSYETVAEHDLVGNNRIIYKIENEKLVKKVVKDKPFDEAYFKDLIRPEDMEMMINAFSNEKIDELIAQGGEEYFEVEVRDRSPEDHDKFLDTYSWYSYIVRGVPKDKWHPRNYVVFEKEIQEAKVHEEEQKQLLKDALENAKSASAAKGQFLSRMSHEIRTPLNAVIGYLSIAKDAEDNHTKIMHCIENSEVAAKHLLSIINDVLDISSIESGKMKIAHEEFHLKGQLMNLSTIFFNQSKAKNVKFEVVLNHLTEEWVVGDSLRLNQILMNLLSNAVKFTPEHGTITLSVTQVNTDEKKVFMKFSVSDTGIGMSEEYQKRLFQPFEQESAVTAQKYGGTGLGLSISFNLISMMGGSIDVDSKLNEGTTFTVSLHFDRSNAEHQAETVQHDYSHVRVLVVDDDKASCDYIKSLLKRCGVKCDIVNDGETAIKRVTSRIGTDYKYDMCLMDWNMPGMNGMETARKLKEECDKELPIIMATAYDVTEFEEEAKEIGITKMIAKPLFQSTMFDILASSYGKYTPLKPKNVNMESLKGIRVLLAEDNPMNREIAIEILEKAGLVVEAVEDGQKAYETFTGKPKDTYDAILMDVQMPIMDGYQATGAIRRSTHPEAKTIPIIAMTANAFAEDVNAALASGMNGHISKPVNYDKLYEVLNKCCLNK